MVIDEIIIYKTEEGLPAIEVAFSNDTVWLTQQQMQHLFNKTKQNISLHIKNIFKENELIQKAVVKESLTAQKEGRPNSYYIVSISPVRKTLK